MAQTKTAAAAATAVTPLIIRTHPSVWTKVALVSRGEDGTVSYSWLKPVKHAARLVRVDIVGDAMVYMQRANFHGEALGDPLRVRQYLVISGGKVTATLDYSQAKAALGITGGGSRRAAADAAEVELPAGAIVL